VQIWLSDLDSSVRISLKQSVTSVQQSLAGSTDVQMEPWVTGLLALGGTVAAPGGTTQPALLAGPPSSETKKISPGGVSEEVKPSAADGSAPDQTIMEISEITDTSSTVHGILPASVTEPEEDSAQLVEAHIDTKLFPDPDYSALEIWEDLRVVSRKVVRLAKKTLSSNDNENSSRTTLAHSSEEVLGSLANTFELADSFGNKYYIDLDHCATWEVCRVAKSTMSSEQETADKSAPPLECSYSMKSSPNCPFRRIFLPTP